VPGLGRSVVWAAFALGVGTIAAVVIFLFRRPIGVSRRLFWLGIAWAAPAVLFWLPQPTPILRHYVLPALGLALACGAGISKINTKRTLLIVATVVIIANVALPEFLYRVYNARHPEDPKTPHGAVFYNHTVMNEQIARWDKGADAVLAATHESSDRAGAVAFAQWAGFAQILYRVTLANESLHPVSKESFYPTVQRRVFAATDRSYEFINYVYFNDEALLDRAATYVSERKRADYAVFMQQELATGTMSTRADTLAIVTF
jgi:hypothetical protein